MIHIYLASRSRRCWARTGLIGGGLSFATVAAALLSLALLPLSQR